VTVAVLHHEEEAGAVLGVSMDVIQGGDDRLWLTRYRKPFGWDGGYTPLGGVLTSSPGTVTKARSGRPDVVGIIAEEKEIANLKYGAWWKAYHP
jgi:hypothetical protein